MNLQHRIDLLVRLGRYILSDDPAWQAVKEEASRKNGWFLPAFINLATENIAHQYLQENKLTKWIRDNHLPAENDRPKTVGVVMAGNIPLVGFHDFLAVFISGHRIAIKASSRDQCLLKHLVARLIEWEPLLNDFISFGVMLKGCDAYITTGSDNSSRYFDYYFGRYPNIIRRNRTSVAILDGRETDAELSLLADDVYLYFGLGCRNVTKLYVPKDYNFVPLLTAFRKYNYLADHPKYKNNYDYNLAILLLNHQYYMSNESILLVEENAVFSPISQLNYEYYAGDGIIPKELDKRQDLQCIIGRSYVGFGQAQRPGIGDFADGVNTLAFVAGL